MVSCRVVGVCLALLLAAATAAPNATGLPNGYLHGCLNQSKGLPFCNPSLPIADRVKDLVGRMTLDEKLALLGPPVVVT